jgi:DNA-binding transcriptional ArsR family regulator
MADLLPSTPDTSAVEDAEPRVVGVDSDDADELLSALSSTTARELLAALHDEPANPAALADRVDTSLQNAQYHLSNLEEAGLIEVVDTAYSAKGREMNVYAPADQPLVVYAGKEEETGGLRSALSRLLGAVGALALSSILVQALFTGPLRGAFDLGGRPGAAPGAGGETNQTTTDTEFEGEDLSGTETARDAEVTDRAAEETATPTDGISIQQTDTPTATATEQPAGTPTATPAEPSPTGAEGTPTPQPTGGETPTEAPLATDTATPTPEADQAAEATATATPTPTPEAAEMAAGIEPGLLFFAGGALVLAMVAAWYWRR